MSNNICALCGRSMEEGDSIVLYDDEECHLQCAIEDQDSIGMDTEFGAS